MGGRLCPQQHFLLALHGVSRMCPCEDSREAALDPRTKAKLENPRGREGEQNLGLLPASPYLSTAYNCCIASSYFEKRKDKTKRLVYPAKASTCYM